MKRDLSTRHNHIRSYNLCIASVNSQICDIPKLGTQALMGKGLPSDDGGYGLQHPMKWRSPTCAGGTYGRVYMRVY